MTLRNHDETVATIWKWRQEGQSFAEIGRALGIHANEARGLMLEESRTADPNEYLIQLECSAIRQKWTPEEEAKRRGGNAPRVEIHRFLVSDGIRHSGIGNI